MSDDAHRGAHRALVSERVALQRRQANTERAAAKKPVVSAPEPMKKRSPSKKKVNSTSASTVASATTSTIIAISRTPSRTPTTRTRTSATSSAPKKNAAQLAKERQQAMVPCRYFSVNGHCPQGSTCPYSHHPDLLGIFGGGSGSQSGMMGMTSSGSNSINRSDSFSQDADDISGGGGGGAHNVQHMRRRQNRERGAGDGTRNAAESFDVDRMDYEQLTALCDSMGTVKIGVDKSKLQALPCITVRTTTVEKCSVCLEQFDMGDTMKILPCSHPFHPECIDEWLDGSKKCPNCNEEILFGVVANSTTGGAAAAAASITPKSAVPPHSSSTQQPLLSSTASPSATSQSQQSSPARPHRLPPLNDVSPPGNNIKSRSYATSSSSSAAAMASRPPLVFRNVQDVMAALEDCP